MQKGEFHEKLNDYGMVLVDECHHAASNTMANILNQVNARYVYGVTATPMRGDGLEKDYLYAAWTDQISLYGKG